MIYWNIHINLYGVLCGVDLDLDLKCWDLSTKDHGQISEQFVLTEGVPHKRSCRKVMFSPASVCSQGGPHNAIDQLQFTWIPPCHQAPGAIIQGHVQTCSLEPYHTGTPLHGHVQLVHYVAWAVGKQVVGIRLKFLLLVWIFARLLLVSISRLRVSSRDAVRLTMLK